MGQSQSTETASQPAQAESERRRPRQAVSDRQSTLGQGQAGGQDPTVATARGCFASDEGPVKPAVYVRFPLPQGLRVTAQGKGGILSFSSGMDFLWNAISEAI